MTSITFDTLGYFEKLKTAGVPEQQAKVQTDALREIIEDRIATKKDLLDLETRLSGKMLEFDGKLRELEYRLTIRLGAMLAASIAIVAALVKLL